MAKIWLMRGLASLALVFLVACSGGTAIPATSTVPATSAPPRAATPDPATAIATTPTRAATATTAPATPTRAPASDSPATPTMAPGHATATTAAASPVATGPPVFPTQPRNLDQPVAQTAHFRFYDPEGAHAATIALLAAEAEEIYAYLVGRTGLQLAEPLPVVVQTQSASACAARGIAYQNGPRIGLFVGPTTPLPQLRMVLAHETAHALHMPYYGIDLDVNLIEGFANWASLRYWSEWQGLASFDDAVRGYLADGRFVPLDNPPADCTIAARDVIYNERASFVGYLIETYGLDRFLDVSGKVVASRRPTLYFIADYEGVYGKSFATLLAEWSESVANP